MKPIALARSFTNASPWLPMSCWLVTVFMFPRSGLEQTVYVVLLCRPSQKPACPQDLVDDFSIGTSLIARQVVPGRHPSGFQGKSSFQRSLKPAFLVK